MVRATGARVAIGFVVAWSVGCGMARAQSDSGFPSPDAGVEPLAAPKAEPAKPVVAAKTLFGAVKGPAPTDPKAIGEYAKGCLAGGKAMPINGRAWQVMRLKRNRNWGHPVLIDFLERFAEDAQAYDGWPGLLVGDMSQPRGGPMLTGHASHQLGLDADIWFTPMPDRRLTPQEREDTSAVTMVALDKTSVDPKVWDDARYRIIKRAASTPQVERIFVNPAIKKALCQGAAGHAERGWLGKVRPWWGHDYHFHVRISCPKDSAGACHPQKPIPGDDGCGKELDDWMKLVTAPPPPPKPADQPVKPPPPPMTLDALPAECRNVLQTGISLGIVKPAAAATAPKWQPAQVFRQ